MGPVRLTLLQVSVSFGASIIKRQKLLRNQEKLLSKHQT